MANSRPVSMIISSGIFDEINTNGSKTVIQKQQSFSTTSSNQQKLPINNIINAHSSSSSIDSTGARNLNSIEKISLPQMNLTTTTSSTTTDSDLESEQEDDNSLQSTNLPTAQGHQLLKRDSGQQKTDINSQEQLSRRVRHFHKLFKSEIGGEMPELIDSYVCAYQGDILLQGKMYITDRYLCFHSRIISYVTKHIYRWEQVKSVTKERVAFIFPTAIGIQLKHTGKKIIYASFLQRDQASDKILSVWSRCSNDTNSFHDADDENNHLTHGGTLKAINSNDGYNEKTKKSKRHDELEEHDDVLQMCLEEQAGTTISNKRRLKSLSSKGSDDKQQQQQQLKKLINSHHSKASLKNANIDQNLFNGLHEDISGNNQTTRNSRSMKNQNKQTDTTLSTSSFSGDSSVGYRQLHPTSLKPDQTRKRDRTLSPSVRSLSNMPHSDSSSSLMTNANSSLNNSNDYGLIKKYFHIIILSVISIIKLLIEYLFLLMNQFKIYPIKISFILIIFITILIFHSFYLIKLAYRIENRLQSLHHLWPSSMKNSLPSSKEL